MSPSERFMEYFKCTRENTVHRDLCINAFVFLVVCSVGFLMGAKEDRIADKSILKSSDMLDAEIPLIEKATKDLNKSVSAYVGTVASGSDVGTVAIGVKQAVADSGYYATLSGVLNTGFTEQINLSSQLYKSLYGESFFFSDDSLIALNQLKTINLLSTQSVGDAYATKVVQAIIAGDNPITGLNKTQVLNSINDTFGVTAFNQAKTTIHTAVGAAYNEANVLLAQDAGIDRFKYAGNIIGDTRPFCIAHLDEVRTIADWNTLNNGQISPVSVYLGGYNCRHKLVGVDDELKENSDEDIANNQRNAEIKKTAQEKAKKPTKKATTSTKPRTAPRVPVVAKVPDKVRPVSKKEKTTLTPETVKKIEDLESKRDKAISDSKNSTGLSENELRDLEKTRRESVFEINSLKRSGKRGARAPKALGTPLNIGTRNSEVSNADLKKVIRLNTDGNKLTVSATRLKEDGLYYPTLNGDIMHSLTSISDGNGFATSGEARAHGKKAIDLFDFDAVKLERAKEQAQLELDIKLGKRKRFGDE